ncbi:MAG: hypothetical protein N2170_09100, partial [Bacteroidia bacterium]|nr:hypothetical protein [Bacteroidia bacterium]
VYGLTRNRTASFWGLVLLQLVMWSAAIGLWIREGEKQGLPQWGLIGGTLFLLFSPFTYYTRVLIPDSFAAAAGLIGLLALYRGGYFIAGVALTVAFFQRPVLGVWLLPAGLWVLWRERQKKTSWLKGAFLLYLPFALAEGAWIGRNYFLYGDFRPLTGTQTIEDPGMYHDVTWVVRRFLKTIGRNTALQWNDPHHPYGLLLCKSDTLPPLSVWRSAFEEFIPISTCPPESLYAIGRELCQLLHAPTYRFSQSTWTLTDPIPTAEDCEREKHIAHQLERCRTSVLKHRPERVWFLSHWKRLQDLRYIPSAAGKTGKIRRLYYEGYFWILLLLSMGCLWAMGKGGAEVRLAAAFALLPLFAYFVLEVIERRYVDLQLPFCMVFLLFSLSRKRTHEQEV